MNPAGLIREIAAVYRKHGWTLRRVLLRDNSRNLPLEIVGDATIEQSEINALWFSRPSQNGAEAWELRRLSQSPFALFESFPSDAPQEKRDAARREMENRLREKSRDLKFAN